MVLDAHALREWVSRAGPEKDAWKHETCRVAVEQGLVVLPGGATVGFDGFVAADALRPRGQVREEDVPVQSRFDLAVVADLEEGGMREQIVLVEEYEGLPRDDISALPGMEDIVKVVGRLRPLERVQPSRRYPWTRLDESNSSPSSGRWTCLWCRRAPWRWRGSARVNECNS